MGWLSGWAKRRPIIISSSDVAALLNNFPILLKLSTSSGKGSTDLTSVFNEIGNDANRKKIAVTLSDGLTQCYVEIERWDNVNKLAFLWIKVAEISNIVDTTLFLYYDSTQPDNTTYVGDIGDAPATNVWDANFLLVLHLRDLTTSTIKDSTSNGYVGNKKAANQPIEADGMINKGQNFTPSNYVTFGNICNVTTGVTLEALAKLDDVSADRSLGNKPFTSLNPPYVRWSIKTFSSRIYLQLSLGGSLIDCYQSGLSTGVWYYFAGTYDKQFMRVSFNDGAKATNAQTANIDTSPTNVAIGDYLLNPAGCDGIIDEFRVSDIRRSDAWISATYKTMFDNFLTWGSEQLPFVPNGVEFRVGVTEPPTSEPKRSIYTDLVNMPDPLKLGIDIRIYNYDDVGLYMRIDGYNAAWTCGTVNCGLVASGANLLQWLDQWASRAKPAAATTEVITIRLRAYTDAGYSNLKWTYTRSITVVMIKSDDGSWTQDILNNFDDGTLQGWSKALLEGSNGDVNGISADFCLSSPYSFRADTRQVGGGVRHQFQKAITTPNKNNVFAIINVRFSDAHQPGNVGLKNFQVLYNSTLLLFVGLAYAGNAAETLPNNRWFRVIVPLPRNTSLTLKLHCYGYSLANWDMRTWIDDFMLISKD